MKLSRRFYKLINVTSNWDFDKAVSLGEKNTAGVAKNMPLIPYINGHIKRQLVDRVENYKYTSSLTDRQVKVTLPSPTMTHLEEVGMRLIGIHILIWMIFMTLQFYIEKKSAN